MNRRRKPADIYEELGIDEDVRIWAIEQYREFEPFVVALRPPNQGQIERSWDALCGHLEAIRNLLAPESPDHDWPLANALIYLQAPDKPGDLHHDDLAALLQLCRKIASADCPKIAKRQQPSENAAREQFVLRLTASIYTVGTGKPPVVTSRDTHGLHSDEGRYRTLVKKFCDEVGLELDSEEGIFARYRRLSEKPNTGAQTDKQK